MFVTQPRMRGKRIAFTLIELLVVIAIIAVLVGLLLPAVQKVREAANRSACQSNMKQLGLALHNHHTLRNGFPHSRSSSGTSPNQIQWSWTVDLMPYIEQDAVHKRWDFGRNWNHADNATPASTVLKVFLCPSAPSGRTGGRISAAYPFRGANDYGALNRVFRGNATHPLTPGLSPNVGEAYPGIMAQNIKRREADVDDGMSNTVLLAEAAGRPQIWRKGRRITATNNGSGTAWSNPGDSASNLLLNGANSSGCFYTRSATAANPCASTAPPFDCAINCTNEGEVYSFHPGTANLLMGDGSVRAVSSTLPLVVLRNLVTRAGGETIDARAFD